MSFVGKEGQEKKVKTKRDFFKIRRIKKLATPSSSPTFAAPLYFIFQPFSSPFPLYSTPNSPRSARLRHSPNSRRTGRRHSPRQQQPVNDHHTTTAHLLLLFLGFSELSSHVIMLLFDFSIYLITTFPSLIEC